MKRSICFLLVLVLTAGSLLTGCGQTAATPTVTAPSTTQTAAPTARATPTATPTVTATGAPQYGGILRMGRRIGPRTLYPWFDGTTDRSRFYWAYDTLLRLDENRAVQPWLATDWKFSPDYKSITLTLRQGIKFHDGTDFNAAAAKYNIEQRRDAKFGDYEDVTSVDVVDDYTVRLNLKEYKNTLLISMWWLAGFMASPTNFQKLGKDVAQWTPVGTGPFKFVSYQTNVVTKYTRFDGYWQKGKPYLDGVEYNIISDSTTRSLSFQRGELDMLQQTESKEAVSLKDKGYILIPPGLGTANVLAPDSTNADSPWANPKVRQAAEYAIDREPITKATGFGFYEAAIQLAQKASYAYNPDVKGRPYDPAKAKQLLTEAGYPNGFKTTLYVRSDSTMMNWLVAAATNLQSVGIDIKVEGVDLGRYTTLQQGGWKNALFTATWWDEPDWLSSAYSALSTTSITMPGVKRPSGLQDMFDKALRTQTDADKKEQAQSIVKALADDATLIPTATFWEGSFTQNYVNETGWSVLQRKSWSPADAWMSAKK